MATGTADSSDRARRRFLPSIRSRVLSPSNEPEGEITVPIAQKDEGERRTNGSGRRTLKGIRSFFSTDRPSRTSANDKNRKRQAEESGFPAVSPQPPSVPTIATLQVETSEGDGENSSVVVDHSKTRTRTRNNYLSTRKQLISLESTLRNVVGEARSSPQSSCTRSRSCSPWSEGNSSVSSEERNSASKTKGRSLNVDKTGKDASSSQLLNVDTDQRASNGHSKLEKKSLSTGSSAIVQQEEDMVMFKNSTELRKEFKKAKAAKDYSTILKFLTTTFNSFSTLTKVFKPMDYDKKCGINIDFAMFAYDVIMALPSDHRKTFLKSVINCLLSNIKKKQDDDDLAGYLILLQNPQFDSYSSYVIFSHLLRQVGSLSDRQHQTLVEWMEWLPIFSFKAMINRLKEFVTASLFPTEDDDLPSAEKMRFWIPSAVKVLALLNAANWLNNMPVVSYTFMYMEALDSINLTKEYDNWQSRSGTFTFCQYPFLLSLSAKRYILQKDSEAQMIEVARRSLVQGVKRREAPAISMLFLNLRVRRDNLMADSLNEISRKREDLKKKLKVTFLGEPGVDMGGLTKEWFMLLVRKVFRPEYGMFRYDDKSSCYWFTNMAVDDMSEFNLVGVLMGLAVYNGTILDIRFPLCCYKKLLSPAVVPFDQNAAVGVTKLELTDLKEVMPELARGLQELLSYEGNVEDDMCQTFQVSSTVCGSVITENLKENGDSMPVTNDNRTEYVDLYVDYILNKSIYRQFAAFYHGFHSVCASNALIMLRPEEVEMLVCGNPDFDMRALCKVTTYDGFSKKDVTIRNFWETVGKFSSSLKRKLLRFCTGSDRIPVGGMAEMAFKITRMTGARQEMLPMAHTCFNQLCLPPYKTRQLLKTKLIIAISNSEGFGIE